MSNDLWRTPEQVVHTLNNEFEFVADMAASNENKVFDLYFDEKLDSLSFCWNEVVRSSFGYTQDIDTNMFVFCNPPYSDPMPWVKQAAKAQLNGLGVVMLLNNDMSVGWFAEALKTVSEIRCVISDEKPESKRGYSSGRVGFLDSEGKPQGGNNKPQFVLIFNPFKIGANITSYITKNQLYGVK
mgnify:CR=1 FL=1